MPVDCTDWSLSPLFAGVQLVPAVHDSARPPMGEGALLLVGLTPMLSFGSPPQSLHGLEVHYCFQRRCCAPLDSWLPHEGVPRTRLQWQSSHTCIQWSRKQRTDHSKTCTNMSL
jgi:hypothetical protein